MPLIFRYRKQCTFCKDQHFSWIDKKVIFLFFEIFWRLIVWYNIRAIFQSEWYFVFNRSFLKLEQDTEFV